jgi:ubiquitin-protein ligase E3 A
MILSLMQEFDFNELENSTEYDGGFSRDTPCVRWFWETVHGESKPLKNFQKNKYLASDRTVKNFLL